MSTVTIYIKKQSDSNGLYFTDSEGHSGNNTITTKVKPGDTVIWQLIPGGGIDAITSIDEIKKAGNQNLFENSPEPVSPKEAKSPWTAQIKEVASGNETYTIKYEISGVTYTFGPDINDPKPNPNDPTIEVDDDGENDGSN